MRPRGTGRVYQRIRRSADGDLLTAATWSIRYYDRRRGKHVDEHGYETDAKAEKVLRRRLADLDRGKRVGPDVERTTFEDLAKMIVMDYTLNRRDSTPRLLEHLARLRATFGRERAIDITEDRISAYQVKRRAAGAAVATVNRELAALRRMFRLGDDAQRVTRRPAIRMMAEKNVRAGFLEPTQFGALVAALPEELRGGVQTAYITAWRIPSEVHTRQWRHVDFQGGWLRLEPGEAKNEEGRMFPLDPELRPILDRQRAYTDQVEAELGRIVPWVFHREGRRIRLYRKSWASACAAAGLASVVKDRAGRVVKITPHVIPHDLRRSAARNMIRAGLPQVVAMRLGGWRTDAVFRRYAIVSEGMLKDGAEQLSRLSGRRP